MKVLLLFVMLFPAVLAAQKIALIDRDFKKPMLFTDSATTGHLAENYFPVYKDDLNAVLIQTAWWIAHIDSGNAQEIMDTVIDAGNSKFVHMVSGANHNARHQLILSTQTNSIAASLRLFEFEDSRRRSIQRLLIFTDYVRNNLAGREDATSRKLDN